jgi:hypothetical protein
MAKKSPDSGEPRFPYTTLPQALRRLLAEIPKRPKPPKLSVETLKAWNVTSSNNATPIGVLKKLGIVGSAGEPTDNYVEFMKTGIGPTVLAQRIRDVYRVLFENSHAPQDESNDELRKLFNIHSGGADETVRLQVQTFKVLAEYANFGSVGAVLGAKDQNVGGAPGSAASSDNQGLPPVQVDLHIHLPENKTTRDYEAIIQDIAKYIYGRQVD